MTNIPSWLLGKHTISVTVTGFTADSTGILTASTSGSLIGQIDSLEITSDPESDEISSADNPIKHHVVVAEDSSIRMTEILRLPVSQQVLPYMAANFTYMKVVYARGVGGALHTFTYWGSRGQYKDGLPGKGKGTAELSLNQIDIGIGAAFTLA